MEIKGDWYLEYLESEVVGTHWVPEDTTSFRLIAQSPDLALIEAQELWEFRLKQGTYQGYNDHIYPNTPSLVQKVNLDPTQFTPIPPENKLFDWVSSINRDTSGIRNGLVSDLKLHSPILARFQVNSLIERAGLQIEDSSNTLLKTTQSFHPASNPELSLFNWAIDFTFRDSVLRNIFVSSPTYTG